jgi:hypothetical protein
MCAVWQGIVIDGLLAVLGNRWIQPQRLFDDRLWLR